MPHVSKQAHHTQHCAMVLCRNMTLFSLKVLELSWSRSASVARTHSQTTMPLFSNYVTQSTKLAHSKCSQNSSRTNNFLRVGSRPSVSSTSLTTQGATTPPTRSRTPSTLRVTSLACATLTKSLKSAQGTLPNNTTESTNSLAFTTLLLARSVNVHRAVQATINRNAGVTIGVNSSAKPSENETTGGCSKQWTATIRS